MKESSDYNEEPIVSGNTGYKSPKIEKGAIGSITIYEVTDMELDILKEGDDGGIKLNVFFFCLSACMSFIISILTCTFDTDFKYGCFLTSTFFLGFIGILYLISYFRSNKKTDNIYKSIKARKPGLKDK